MNSPADSSPPAASRDRTPLLVVLNAALVLILVVVTLGGQTRASAQTGRQAPIRAHGEYSVLAPKSAGGNTGSVVIIDSVNSEMACLEWDKTRRALVVTSYRDLTADATENIGR